MTYNDLIDVKFVDAAEHDVVNTGDILGVVMPYHWGPAGVVRLFDALSFYDSYPEVKNEKVVVSDTVYKAYYQVKSYFENGGSTVAVFRPNVTTELFGMSEQIGSTGKYLAFKYPGIPCLTGSISSDSFEVTTGSTEFIVRFKVGNVTIEEFTGQLANPEGNIEGETTYLPLILEQKSQYLQITDTAPSAIQTSYTPTVGTDTIATVFGRSDALVPTQFLEYNATLDNYQSAVFFSAEELDATAPTIVSKFNLPVKGTEFVKVFGVSHTIPCNAGVAGAYTRVASDENINQVASGRSYGTYRGVINSDRSFADVINDGSKGFITVFNSTTGPQIYGVRNSYASQRPSSYFAKANVSRVLAAILRNIKPMAMDAIHTATAADDIKRAIFESRLNSVLVTFIGSKDIKDDSKAVCSKKNNTDTLTRGGSILNIDLWLHFIGLVEGVKIRVIATDSSVTAEIV